jgi:putative oxidoreductase
MQTTYQRFLHLENQIHHQLVAHSIAGLRIAVGLIFLGFGVLKFFPGVSPAQDLTEATTHILFLGLVPGGVALVMIATLECVIGICLLANRGMRLAVWLLAIEFVGILSPLVLLPARLFAGPHHAPTLEGQYVLKDIILVAAALVIAAGSFRGGRMVRTDLNPSAVVDPDAEINAEAKARIVLEGVSDESLIKATCDRNHVSEADFYTWRETSMVGATAALSRAEADVMDDPVDPQGR